MAITSVSSAASNPGSTINQDVQVRQIKAKIQDWSTCPTTDPATKKVIVDRLQTQLDALTASLQAREKAKESSATGLGASLDLKV